MRNPPRARTRSPRPGRNVTEDEIQVRKVVFSEDVWPPPLANTPPPVDRSIMLIESDFIRAGAMDVSEIIGSGGK